MDEFWHLHLTHSSDYWDVWCGAVLQGPLHHDPTPGGVAPQARFRVGAALRHQGILVNGKKLRRLMHEHDL